MDDQDRSFFKELFGARRDGSPDAASEDLAKIIKRHGDTVVRQAVAKALPAADEGLSQEDQDAITALASGTIAKTTDSSSMEDRMKTIEDALVALADGKTSTETSPDALELAKQGVPFDAIEAAKPLLEHADRTVRESTAAMLVKQADPERMALLAKESGSAQVPAEDAEKTRMLKQLAKQNGDAADEPSAGQILAALAKAAN